MTYYGLHLIVMPSTWGLTPLCVVAYDDFRPTDYFVDVQRAMTHIMRGCPRDVR